MVELETREVKRRMRRAARNASAGYGKDGTREGHDCKAIA
jgi:hypothetical protein